MIRACSNLSDLEHSLPLPVGDFFHSNTEYSQAVRLYLQGGDFKMAEKSTARAIGMVESNQRCDMLQNIVKFWEGHKEAKNFLPSSSISFLLLLLFRSPKDAAAAQQAQKCVSMLGCKVIKLAVSQKGLSKKVLYDFSSEAFKVEVTKALVEEYKGNPIGVLQWYVHRNNSSRATEVAKDVFMKCSNDELFKMMSLITSKETHISELLFKEVLNREKKTKKDLFINTVKIYLNSNSWNLELAFKASTETLRTKEKVAKNMTQVSKEWYSKRNDERIRDALSRKFRMKNPTNFLVSLNLLLNPEDPRNVTFSKRFIKQFGPKIVESLVLKSVSNPKHAFSILAKFDVSAFNHLQEKIREKEIRQKEILQEETFAVNDRVKVHNLLKRKDLNGKLGTIIQGKNKKSERYEVKLDGINKTWALKASNIVKDHSNMESSSDNSYEFNDSDSDSSSSSDAHGPPPLLPRRNDSDSESNSSGDIPPLNSQDSSVTSDDDDVSVTHGRSRRAQVVNSDSSDDSSMPDLVSHAKSSSDSDNGSNDSDSDSDSQRGFRRVQPKNSPRKQQPSRRKKKGGKKR
mmetsp:Transcript_44079/g.86433  ORF Transcript_44079/g.86433 Transcript_44079/m.86433 type:complete len:573 (-) Transcript_44079:5-1723(-)